MVYGANLDAIEKIARVSPTKVLGVPGTSVWNGYVQENELKSELTGDRKYTTYSNILANVSIVAAATRYFLNLISNSDWTIEPADDSPEAERLAEEIEKIKDNMLTPWRRVIRKSVTYKFYGFSVQEWTAKRNADGIIAIHRIDARPQSTIKRWFRNEIGDIEEVVQESPQTYEELTLPRGKLIYLVDDALNDSPEGFGFFRHLAEPARRLQRFEQLEGYGFETDLRGIPVGRIPYAELNRLVANGEITEEQRTLITQPLENFIQNHIKNPQLGLLLDSMTYQSTDDAGTPSNVKQWDMELLKAGATSQPEIAKTIQRLNEELARVLNMEGLLLGAGDNGSRALSVDKTNNLAIVTEATQKEVAEVFDKDFIGVIGQLNGWDEDLLPSCKPEPIRFRDIREITQALSDMASAGALLSEDDPIINAVRDMLSMPRQPEIRLQDNAEDSALSARPGNREDIDSMVNDTLTGVDEDDS